MKKSISAISLIIQAIFYLFLGLLCFNRSLFLWTFIYIIMLIGEGIIIIGVIYELIINHKSHSLFNNLLLLLVAIGCFLFTYTHPSSIGIFIPWIIGWYALLISLIQAINYYIYRQDSLRGTFWRFTLFLISFLFGLAMVLNPLEKTQFISRIAGCWLFFYGVVTLAEAGKQIISESFKRNLRKHMNISVPILVAALIPIKAFSSISKLGEHVPLQKDNNSDVEVFIYLKGYGPEQLGHVDLAIGNTIYSYGLHDPKARKLNGTYGDGVLIVSDRYTFLKEHLETEDKLIVSYGLTLTTQQKEMIQTRVDELMLRTIPWKCPYQAGDLQAKDYASRVAKVTSCKMYKFTERKFKTYFVFSTNCVLLADHILRCDELDLFVFYGIVTPGSYLNFLNTEYLRKNTNVTSRSVYDRNSI